MNYDLYIRPLVCFPSYILFTSIFSLSNYELRLWELKYLVESNKKNLKNDIIMFAFYNSQNVSDSFCNDLIRIKRNINLDINQTKLFLNRELIRIQPIRYMWREHKDWGFFANACFFGLCCFYGKYRTYVPRNIIKGYIGLNVFNFGHLVGNHKIPRGKFI